MYLCGLLLFFFFFKQKTAYEMRISDSSSDVCSSDLLKSNAQKTGRNFRRHASGSPERDGQGRRGTKKPRFRGSFALGCGRSGRNDVDVELAGRAAGTELHLAFGQREDRVILAEARADTGVILGTALADDDRSDERRVGKECVSACRSRGSTDNK